MEQSQLTQHMGTGMISNPSSTSLNKVSTKEFQAQRNSISPLRPIKNSPSKKRKSSRSGSKHRSKKVDVSYLNDSRSPVQDHIMEIQNFTVDNLASSYGAA